MRRILLIFTCVVALGTLTAVGQDRKDDRKDDKKDDSSDGPAVGQTAPDFGLPWATADAYHFRDVLKLSEQRGHNVILAFYAADWSPG